MSNSDSRILTPSGIQLSNPEAAVIRPSRKRRHRTPNLKLRSARINAGLSPNQLGDEAKVSGATVRGAERGRIPHPDTQLKIVTPLGLTPLDIWPLEVPKVLK